MKSSKLSSMVVHSLLAATLCTIGNVSIADTQQVASVSPEEMTKLVASCSACHGADGISPSAEWPNLAGQKAGYMATQIKAVRDGSREVPTMSVFVQDLDDAQIEALSEHYASLPAAGGPTMASASLPGANIRGKCISCHGVEGKTVNQEWPNLAGQKKEYLEAQLLAFRSGSRVGPPMNNIARMFDEQEIKDVAEYYSQTGK
ncbi:c-type cytochrome [Granulosicoccus antarcticus]|uniref:Cytochrome c-552 n=1 Tax=Granulosicoccus antarcticus IMCC3135 TaxID=1192854 RepID=A0A2Z2P128_9GAMM|nr:c-type cytochrome [Granulosicoccus antarcticus]ASJ74017.1 Cytochrome c-552 [Granulosicoccus antarcticus IMCC3135]